MIQKISLVGKQKEVMFLPPENPILIKGVAGSGKTTIALYRAHHLILNHNDMFNKTKVGIFTFNKTLNQYLASLCPEITDQFDNVKIEVKTFHSWAYHIASLSKYTNIKSWEKLQLLENLVRRKPAARSKIHTKSIEFFEEEISWIKGKNFQSLEEYTNTVRSGRGRSDRVTKVDKEYIWNIFRQYREELQEFGKIDFDDYAILALKHIEENIETIEKYSHIIIDEAQDLNKTQILALSKLISPETNSISLIADSAQRIYKSGFTWKEVGLEVRGRTKEFSKNYRNTSAIALAAKSLLEHDEDNSDFTTIEPGGLPGPLPVIAGLSTFESQLKYLNVIFKFLTEKGELESTVVLHRTNQGVKSIVQFLEASNYNCNNLHSTQFITMDKINVCTMSSIKGLEFNNVIIMGLDDDIIPFPPGFVDEGDEHHISTERRLLYTCMTRAKTWLYLTHTRTNPSRYLSEISKELIKRFD